MTRGGKSLPHDCGGDDLGDVGDLQDGLAGRGAVDDDVSASVVGCSNNAPGGAGEFGWQVDRMKSSRCTSISSAIASD
jgi:hypothetical protein